MINKKCIEQETNNFWKLIIRDHVLIMNTKFTRIHEYSAAKIMFEFKFKHVHLNIEFLILSNLKHAENALSNHQYQLYATLRDEIRMLSNEVVSYIYDHAKHLQRKQKIFKINNLIMIRNHAVNDIHIKKFEVK